MKFSIKRFFRVAVLLLAVFMAFDLGLHGVFHVLAGDDVSAQIGLAEDALRRAFVAVLDAEDAGVNVSGLLVKLDVAGKNLTEAEMAYGSGRLGEALIEAEWCSFLAYEVANEAAGLKSSALPQARSTEWQMFAFSSVGAFAFLTFLVLGWVLFRRHYAEKLLGMKPEDDFDVEA